VRKRLSVGLLVLVVICATATTVGAGGWTERISGGSSYSTNYGEFTVTLSAWQKADGGFAGEGQYYYPPLNRTFHLDVMQVCFAPDLSWAAAIGTVRGQDGTEVTGGGWGGIAILEGGDGPDRFRVWFDREQAAMEAWCQAGAYGSFPAAVEDGNFNIRSK
jgi:hypothetical protein